MTEQQQTAAALPQQQQAQPQQSAAPMPAQSQPQPQAAPQAAPGDTPVWNENRVFFDPDELATGNAESNNLPLNEFIAAITRQLAHSETPIPLHGWDEATQGAWPENAGAAVLPFTRRRTKHVHNPATGKTEEIKYTATIAAFVWPVFSVAAILGTPLGNVGNPNGLAYIRDAIYADQANRILNPLRRQNIGTVITHDDGSRSIFTPDMSSVPKTVKDHIEGMAGDKGELKAFNDVSKVWLAQLKQMSPIFAIFTAPIMRQMLSSSAMATAFNAEVEAKGFWVDLLNSMEAYARDVAKIGNVSIYQRWRDTRSDQEAFDLSAISIENLGGLAAPVAPPQQ